MCAIVLVSPSAVPAMCSVSTARPSVMCHEDVTMRSGLSPTWSSWPASTEAIAIAGSRHCCATRGAEGAVKAPQTRPTMAQRRILCPAASRAPQPRLVLRLRPSQNPRWTGVPDAERHGRAHPRMPVDPCSSQALFGRRHRRADRPVHHAWGRPTSGQITAQSSSLRPYADGSLPWEHKPRSSSLAHPGRTATSRASTRASGTSCSTARSSKA